MQWNNEAQNASRDQSQSEYDNRQSIPYRSSATDKMKSSVLKNSAFRGLVNTMSTGEARPTKQSKQEGAAQGWDGKALYEMDPNSSPREEIDTTFLLFEQLPKDVRILTMACTNQHAFLVTTLGYVYSWGTQTESLGRKALAKQEARTPTPIPELREIVNIVTGDNHVLALDIHGCVYSWGSNQHGQLGLGQTIQICDMPNHIQTLDDVAQIYAGPACSFAVTRAGALYCWGQNSYGQLGQAGPDVFLPKEMHPQSTPWNKENDIAIVTGKTHVGYVFTTLTSSKHKTLKSVVNTLEHRKQDLEIKELREKLKKLTDKNTKLKEHLVGKVPKVELERNFEEDAIIKQLKEDLRVTKEEITYIDQRTKHLKDEISGVKSDLAGIQQQLKDIETRETTLSDEIQHLENEILQKRDRTADKNLLRQKKTAEDLARANEQIKNMIQQKLSERTDKERELQHENSSLEKKRAKLSAREDMVIKLMAERKTTIAQGAFAENQSEITGLIHNLYSIFKQARDTTVEETSKNLEVEKGLLDILGDSNEQLLKYKKDADKLKVNPSDALFEITSKILEMFQDNLNTRLKMNEYSALVYAQVTEKLNDAALLDPKKKIDDKKKARDTRIAQLKQKYNIDQTRATLAPNNLQKLNLSNNNNSMQRATLQGVTPKNMISQSHDESPDNIKDNY